MKVIRRHLLAENAYLYPKGLANCAPEGAGLHALALLGWANVVARNLLVEQAHKRALADGAKGIAALRESKNDHQHGRAFLDAGRDSYRWAWERMRTEGVNVTLPPLSLRRLVACLGWPDDGRYAGRVSAALEFWQQRGVLSVLWAGRKVIVVMADHHMKALCERYVVVRRRDLCTRSDASYRLSLLLAAWTRQHRPQHRHPWFLAAWLRRLDIGKGYRWPAEQRAALAKAVAAIGYSVSEQRDGKLAVVPARQGCAGSWQRPNPEPSRYRRWVEAEQARWRPTSQATSAIEPLPVRLPPRATTPTAAQHGLAIVGGLAGYDPNRPRPASRANAANERLAPKPGAPDPDAEWADAI